MGRFSPIDWLVGMIYKSLSDNPTYPVITVTKQNPDLTGTVICTVQGVRYSVTIARADGKKET